MWQTEWIQPRNIENESNFSIIIFFLFIIIEQIIRVPPNLRKILLKNKIFTEYGCPLNPADGFLGRCCKTFQSMPKGSTLDLLYTRLVDIDVILHDIAFDFLGGSHFGDLEFGFEKNKILTIFFR